MQSLISTNKYLTKNRDKYIMKKMNCVLLCELENYCVCVKLEIKNK